MKEGASLKRKKSELNSVILPRRDQSEKHLVFEHDFLIIKNYNDKEIGQVKIKKFISPYRFCVIESIKIQKGDRGAGLGRDILFSLKVNTSKLCFETVIQ